MKKNEKTKGYGAKGITLIALVVTIIVLLILAGVTLATLLGEGGIIQRTQDAKGTHENAEILEQLKLEVAGNYDKYLKLNAGTLKTSIEADIAGATVTGSDFPLTVAVKGKSYTIAGNGTVTLNTGTVVTPSENTVESLAKAGEIQRWDKINYNPGTGTTTGLSLPAGATLNGTISASEATEWVVLDVDRTTGEVKIVPTTVSNSTLKLSGKDGYNNAIEALDAVAGIYSNPTYATSSKSITVEDLNKVEGYTPNGTNTTETYNHKYGIDAETLDITGDENSEIKSQTFISTASSRLYQYVVYCLKYPEFWLASHCVDVSSTNLDFYVRYVTGIVSGSGLFHAYGLFNSYGSDNSYRVIPIVVMKSNVQLESNGSYTITGTASSTAMEEKIGEHNVWKIQQ